jgi:hypothetical protein
VSGVRVFVKTLNTDHSNCRCALFGNLFHGDVFKSDFVAWNELRKVCNELERIRKLIGRLICGTDLELGRRHGGIPRKFVGLAGIYVYSTISVYNRQFDTPNALK